jgi:hypothetical protein
MTLSIELGFGIVAAAGFLFGFGQSVGQAVGRRVALALAPKPFIVRERAPRITIGSEVSPVPASPGDLWMLNPGGPVYRMNDAGAWIRVGCRGEGGRGGPRSTGGYQPIRDPDAGEATPPGAL